MYTDFFFQRIYTGGGSLFLLDIQREAHRLPKKLLPAFRTFWRRGVAFLCEKSWCVQNRVALNFFGQSFCCHLINMRVDYHQCRRRKCWIFDAPHQSSRGCAFRCIEGPGKLSRQQRQIWWSRSAISIIQQLVKSLQGAELSLFLLSECESLLLSCFCFAQRCSSSLNEDKLISQSLEKRGKNANWNATQQQQRRHGGAI
jgi:hypothetical protein